MWPFGKKQAPDAQALPTNQISYSQIDVTETFGDNLRLKPDEWIETIPLNSMVGNPESVGLPGVDAGEEEIFEVASRLSRMRESVQISSDGVYCAVCHIANVQLEKLRSPCPKCGRELLKFGWD